MNVLYISANYSTEQGVNANRVFDLLSFFSQHGVRVTHLTPHPATKVPGVKNWVVPFSHQKKESMYYAFFKAMIDWTDSHQHETWVNDIIADVQRRPRRFRQFDVIYINTQPRCLIKLARFFKTQLALPCIIDFQDPFAFDPYRLNWARFDAQVEQYERWLLAPIAALVVITPSMEVVYRRQYPRLTIAYVPTAIPEYIAALPITVPTGDASSIKVVYGGSLHGQRQIFPFLRGVRQSLRSVDVQVVGNSSMFTRPRYWLYPEVKWLPAMHRQQYLEYFNQHAHIGLVVQSFALRETGISGIAAKTYEYLALNKPIVFIGPEGDNTALIRKYSLNYCIITYPGDNGQAVAEFLSTFRFKRKNTRTAFFTDYQPQQKYGTLLKLLETVASHSQP